MSKKSKKKGNLENWFYKISPFGKRFTKTVLYIIVVINFTISGFLFNQTISTLESTQEIAQDFNQRVENTRSR